MTPTARARVKFTGGGAVRKYRPNSKRPDGWFTNGYGELVKGTVLQRRALLEEGQEAHLVTVVAAGTDTPWVGVTDSGLRVTGWDHRDIHPSLTLRKPGTGTRALPTLRGTYYHKPDTTHAISSQRWQFQETDFGWCPLREAWSTQAYPMSRQPRLASWPPSSPDP